MKPLLITSIIVCSLFSISQTKAMEEDLEKRRSNLCSSKYTPPYKYNLIGTNREKEVAYLRRVSNKSFLTRWGIGWEMLTSQSFLKFLKFK